MTNEEKQQKKIERELKTKRKQIEFLKKTFGVEEHTEEEAEEVFLLAGYVMGFFDEKKDKYKIRLAKRIAKKTYRDHLSNIIKE